MKKISLLGFTLLELLVVIGIIGILVGLGSVSYSSAQKKARDAKRHSDLSDIQKFYEQYYSLCGFKYGVGTTDYGTLGTVPDGTDIGANLTDCNLNIILKWPKDPLGANYKGYSLSSSSYTICPPVVRTVSSVDYLMETEGCTGVNKNCCVSNQQ